MKTIKIQPNPTKSNPIQSNLILRKIEKQPRPSPVLDLHKVTDEAVSSAALNEIPLCLEEFLRRPSSKLVDKIVEERHLAVLLDLVDRDCVNDRFDHSTVI